MQDDQHTFYKCCAHNQGTSDPQGFPNKHNIQVLVPFFFCGSSIELGEILIRFLFRFPFSFFISGGGGGMFSFFFFFGVFFGRFFFFF